MLIKLEPIYTLSHEDYVLVDVDSVEDVLKRFNKVLSQEEINALGQLTALALSGEMEIDKMLPPDKAGTLNVLGAKFGLTTRRLADLIESLLGIEFLEELVKRAGIAPVEVEDYVVTFGDFSEETEED